jgi:hypothetical protein
MAIEQTPELRIEGSKKPQIASSGVGPNDSNLLKT